MTVKRGKLYESVVDDLTDTHWYFPNIMESLNEAKKQLSNVKTIEQLNPWITEWFGDVEEDASEA